MPFKIILFTFYVLFFALNITAKNKIPIAHKGLINLSEFNLYQNGNVNLQGEWEFYWQTFNTQASKKTYIAVPGLWNGKVINQNIINGKGYALYKLKVYLGSNKGYLALKLLNAATSIEIFINNNYIGSIGTPASSHKNYKPSYKPTIFPFQATTDTIIITAKVANFEHHKGGIWEPIYLGTFNTISQNREKDLFLDFFLMGAILIMSVYHLALFFMRRKARYNIFFSLFCFFLLLRLAVTGSYFIYSFNEISWYSIIKIEYISFYMVAPMFGLFMYSVYPRNYNRHVAHIFLLLSIIFSIGVILLPTAIFTQTMLYYEIITIFTGMYVFWVMYRCIVMKRTFSRILMFGWIILFACLFNDILYQNQILFTGYYTYIGLLVFITIMSLVISIRYSKVLLNLEKARKDLNYINHGLEVAVEARTMEMMLQKERIEAQNRDMLGSINYASRIQTTILPDRKLFNKFFSEHFIIHLPKDIVSGDFYWLRQYNNKLFIALADCTGHGIPGAFMSFLGHSLLNEAFIRFTGLAGMSHLMQPDIIMNYLRQRIKESLKQTGDTGEVSDGMDLGLCIYDKNTQKLYFSGANIPLVITREIKEHDVYEVIGNKVDRYAIGSKFEMLQLKPDRMPLGIYVNEVSFSNYSLTLEKGDQLYLFTDGFEDQMGGENDKKFSRSRLLKFIQSITLNPTTEQYTQLMDVFMDWKLAANQEQIDDVSFIGIRV